MDINALRRRLQLALLLQERAGNDEERRAYRLFERDYFIIDATPPDSVGNHREKRR